MYPESLDIVVRPGEPADFELAAIAGAAVDLPYRERAAEEPCDLRGQSIADSLEVARASDRLRDDARAERGPELAKHRSAPRRPARLLAERAQHGLGAGQLVVEDRRATSSRSPTSGSRISYRTVVPSFRAVTMFLARRIASCCETID
jgi:hypothetical protein